MTTGTCFNTGRQVTHLLCRFLIDEMIVSTNGNRHARSTPESCRHGGRGWIPRWATFGLMQRTQPRFSHIGNTDRRWYGGRAGETQVLLSYTMLLLYDGSRVRVRERKAGA
jgi:hypothetical protein